MAERNVYSTEAWVSQVADVVHDRLKSDGGGGKSTPMEERVTRLETHMEYVRRDLDDLKTGQSTILATLQELKADAVATRGHAAGKVTVISTGIAIVAIIIGVMAFGGDRFGQGMEVAAAADAARNGAASRPWDDAPIVEPATAPK